VTSPVPRLLLDTCSIINLTYCAPVAAAFRSRYEGIAGWTQAAKDELVRQRGRMPPHPQAGKAANWAVTWLGVPIEIIDEDLLIAITRIQHDIAVGGADSALDHLGEAASIALLQSAGSGRLTIDESGIDAAMADVYLETLQSCDRMHAPLKSTDLLMGDLGPWQ
jgi:hypothetical protein